MRDATQGCCDTNEGGLVAADAVRAELLGRIRPVEGREYVPLEKAGGRVLASDLEAVLPLPPRDLSAMDGYALGPSDGSGRYRVLARTAAGEDAFSGGIGAGEAVRIFTGAPIPRGTDAVVMQELVTRDGDSITLAKAPKPGQHIRRGGEDVARGDIITPAGTRLDPRHVAIMAASGITEVPVVRQVRVGLFSSGKELCEPGAALGPASIHDSNRWMLKSLLSGGDVEVEDLGILPDNRDAIAASLDAASNRVDLLIGTGGVSVGEEDHVLAALAQIGAEPSKRKMAVKPGKPMVFAQKNGAFVLGLPGNPVSALVSFLLLARPCIMALEGAQSAPVAATPAVADFEWSRKAGRAEFFPARVVGLNDDGLPLLDKLGRGGSAQLRPLITADGLARVNPDRERVAPGERIDWFPFATGFAL